MFDYVIHFDGGAERNPGPIRYAYQIRDVAEGSVERKSKFNLAEGTNNQAEYMALLEALKRLLVFLEKENKLPRAISLQVRGDSQLVICQMQGKWQCKNPGLRSFYDKARTLSAKFKKISFKYVPRKQNVKELGM